MQTLFDIRKRTEYASYEKYVDNAPKAPGAAGDTPQNRAILQNMQFRKHARHSASKTAKRPTPIL